MGCLGRAVLAGAVFVIIRRQQQRRIRVAGAQLPCHCGQVIGTESHADTFPGQLMHGQAGGIALSQPDNVSILAGQEMTGVFHLSPGQRTFVAFGVNQLDVDHLTGAVGQG
ncbi:hypothetical protein D3C75_953830 [compost metagenome]